MEKLWSTMKGAMGRISNVGDPLGLHTFLCTSSLGLDVASVLQTLCDPVVAHCDKKRVVLRPHGDCLRSPVIAGMSSHYQMFYVNIAME